MTTNVKKISLLIIAAVLLIGIAFAGTGAAATYSGGSGTAEDPYLISTALDLYNLSIEYTWQDKKDPYYYKLTNNISLSNITSIVRNDAAQTITIESSSADPMVYNYSSRTFSQSNWNPGFDASVVAKHPDLSTWVPIGSNTEVGIDGKIYFDGNGKVISGLFINSTDFKGGFTGLFGGIDIQKSGEVRVTNLTLVNSFVCSNDRYIGGFIGGASQDDYKMKTPSLVANCTVMNSAVCSLSKQRDTSIGGIVGFAGGASYFDIKNCTVLNSTVTSMYMSGGLVGRAATGDWISDQGSIEDSRVIHCTLVSPFGGDGGTNVGGLVGYLGENTHFPVRTSSVLSCVLIGQSYVGGLVGAMASNGNSSVTDCHVLNCRIIATQNEKHGDHIGGLVGDIGQAHDSTVPILENCTVTDTPVTGFNTVGGVAGSIEMSRINNVSVTNCAIVARISTVGGLAGYIMGSSILNCTVADCSEISGLGVVGGFAGWITGDGKSQIENNRIVNATIIATDPREENGVGGFSGMTRTDLGENPLRFVNTTLKDLVIKSPSTQNVYLFDSLLYKIYSANGIARLAQIDLSDDNTIINSCVLVDDKANAQENTVLEGFTDVKDKLVSITVSNPKVTSIAKDAFKWDSGKGIYSTLQEITGLDSITSVGDSAFEECHELTSIDLKNAKTIGKNAFKQSDSMKAICLRNVETIGDSAFENCSSLRKTVVWYYGDLADYLPTLKMSFPKTLKTIGNRAFYGCSNFGNVNPPSSWFAEFLPIEIPEGTESIGDKAFYGCENICSITVPSTVTSVGNAVFGERLKDGTNISICDKDNLKGIIYDNTGGLITNAAFNEYTNIAAVLVNKTTLEYKFLHNGDLTQSNYELKNAYGNAPSVNPNAKNLSAPNFMGWSTVPGNYSDETKAENTTQLLYNDTGKYYYLYQVWDDETIYTLQQVYDVDDNPLPRVYVDRNQDWIISYEDGYGYKLTLKYGVKQIPLFGDERESGYTYQYHLWALKYNATSDKLEKVEDLIKPGTDRYLKPNVVVTYEDGTVVRYTDSEGRYVYNGSDPFFGSLYTDYAIEEIQTPIPVTPTPSHKESGQTVIQQQAPVQDVSADPTPANQATADITVKYVSQSVIGTSASDVAAIKQVSAEAAAQMEIMLSTAQAAGIPLTNSKGAKAVVVTSENIPNVEKVTFSRVYEISPANEGEKLTKVTVKVPKSDVTSKGLTSDDVNVYHYLESYNIWVPLEIISMTQDENNYYYTAATDGTSPFGVLVKKIGSDTATPTTQPTQTQKSPAPFVGILAGLGAALVLTRLRK